MSQPGKVVRNPYGTIRCMRGGPMLDEEQRIAGAAFFLILEEQTPPPLRHGSVEEEDMLIQVKARTTDLLAQQGLILDRNDAAAYEYRAEKHPIGPFPLVTKTCIEVTCAVRYSLAGQSGPVPWCS